MPQCEYYAFNANDLKARKSDRGGDSGGTDTGRLGNYTVDGALQNSLINIARREGQTTINLTNDHLKSQDLELSDCSVKQGNDFGTGKMVKTMIVPDPKIDSGKGVPTLKNKTSPRAAKVKSSLPPKKIVNRNAQFN